MTRMMSGMVEAAVPVRNRPPLDPVQRWEERWRKNIEVIENLQDCGSVGDSVTYFSIPKGFWLNIWDIQISLVLLERVLAARGHFYKTF